MEYSGVILGAYSDFTGSRQPRGLEFRARDLGIKVSGLELRARDQGLGFRVKG